MKWRCIEQNVTSRTHGLSLGIQNAGWLTPVKESQEYISPLISTLPLHLYYFAFSHAKFNVVHIKDHAIRPTIEIIPNTNIYCGIEKIQ